MTRPRRILVVSTLYPPHVIGGAELVAQQLARGLLRRGQQVAVLSTCGPDAGPGLHVGEDQGVPVWRFFPRNAYWTYSTRERPLLRKIAWHARDAYNAHTSRVVDELLDRLHPDLVHTHNIDGFSPAVWRVVQARGIPIVHTAHDFHLVCPRARLLHGSGELCVQAPWPCHLYRRWYARFADAIDPFCAPSRFLIQEHERLGLQLRSSRVVHNGLEPVPGEAPERTPGPLRALFLGQLEPHKGVRVLLDALRMIPRKVVFEITVAGTGSLLRHVQACAADDPRLRAVGFVDGEAKRALLEQSDVMLVPSQWYENAPLSVIEALHHGLLVVASDIGGIPEYVESGKTGLLVQPGDPGALAAVMATLSGYPGRLQLMQQAARLSAGRFTVERMIDAYTEIYDERVGMRRQ
ncbi:MAG: glycosyltransferase family 4 protein [Pseudomonadota bacterium]